MIAKRHTAFPLFFTVSAVYSVHASTGTIADTRAHVLILQCVRVYRVSSELGAGRPRLASHASSVSLCLDVVCTLGVGALICLFRYSLQPKGSRSCHTHTKLWRHSLTCGCVCVCL